MAFKLPNLGDIADAAGKIDNFLAIANAKIDAQTAAIKFLADHIKVQHEHIRIISEHLGIYPAADANGAAGLVGKPETASDVGGEAGGGGNEIDGVGKEN